MHGSIACGLCPALLEQVVYDEQGHLNTYDFQTYPVPRASDMPDFELDRTVTPTNVNGMGAKGAGDVSQPAVCPAIVNAICDALSEKKEHQHNNPVTPE